MRSDYHFNTSRRGERRGRFNFLDAIVLIVTLVCTALLLLSYFARWFNPLDGWLIPILGLAFPVLYIINLMLALYWVLRWKGVMLLPIAALLLGIGSISLFFHPSLRKHYDDDKQKLGKDAITVMSYNVEGFLNREASRSDAPEMDSTAYFIARQSPDILCMQEYQITERMPAARIDSILHTLSNKTTHFSLTGRKGAYGWGLAIYTRFKIIAHQNVVFDNTSNSAMWADILIAPKDTMRIINCHLQTTSLSHSDRNFMTANGFIHSDNNLKSRRIRTIAVKLRNNYIIRAAQADTIASIISQTRYPVVVCGDFNDTPMSYAYNTIRGDMRDSFVEKGRGASNTYRGFFNLFRIDYIMHSPGWEALSYDSPESICSDHNPVVVKLRPKKS